MKKFALACVAMLFSTIVLAAPKAAPAEDAPVVLPAGVSQYVIASGKEEGVYFKIVGDIIKVCPKPVMTNQKTGGSVDNVTMLLDNQAAMAPVQPDVLLARKIIDNDPDVDGLAVLMPLYAEKVFIMTKASNTMINKFADLGNKKIGVVGGAAVTQRVLFALNRMAPLGNVTIYNSVIAAAGAAYKGEVDAVFAVTTEANDDMKKIPVNTVKFVSFTNERADAIYQPAKLSMPNISQGVDGLQMTTFLMTYNYTSKGKSQDILDLKKCIVRNLPVLREETGFQKAWRSVQPDASVKWKVYTGK